jgi:deoxycytidine triphosphate deaminase
MFRPYPNRTGESDPVNNGATTQANPWVLHFTSHPPKAMILNDVTIRVLSTSQHGAKPLISPFREEQLNPASYDVVIGSSIQIQERETQSPRDSLHPVWQTVNISKHSKDYPYVIGPGEAILAATEERFNLPDNISCMFKLKSSRARELYNHMFAGFGDPGWFDSTYTLELINHGKYNCLPIYPGLKIGQVIFWETMPVEASYAVKGHYNGQRGAQVSLT